MGFLGIMDTNTHFVATKQCNYGAYLLSLGDSGAFALNFATNIDRYFTNQDYNIDFLSTDNILVSGTGGYLFWGIKTPIQNGEYQSIYWYNPRFIFIGREDDSAYNRLSELKTIMTVFGDQNFFGFGSCRRVFITALFFFARFLNSLLSIDEEVSYA